MGIISTVAESAPAVTCTTSPMRMSVRLPSGGCGSTWNQVPPPVNDCPVPMIWLSRVTVT
ncbi:MAG: hypothetical protein CVU38_18645 [Chloroflexi bacterium HGW-Chloroflexi-1]|nr:MAG: hypothetical protein CVU38_18645 [Chloroflexi bacterium HGW-Chloroflexi-1]